MQSSMAPEILAFRGKSVVSLMTMCECFHSNASFRMIKQIKRAVQSSLTMMQGKAHCDAMLHALDPCYIEGRLWADLRDENIV